MFRKFWYFGYQHCSSEAELIIFFIRRGVVGVKRVENRSKHTIGKEAELIVTGPRCRVFLDVLENS